MICSVLRDLSNLLLIINAFHRFTLSLLGHRDSFHAEYRSKLASILLPGAWNHAAELDICY